ncbi:MAG: hypothetical protein NTW71_10730 [Deltaproteobacteria bacterium]|nr:hypothetical protein [Deltaproteobacteria bacterium]
MFLTLPDGGKDLQEPGIETWNGQKWLRLGSYLYRPLSGISLLASGPSTISIPYNRDGGEYGLAPPGTGHLLIIFGCHLHSGNSTFHAFIFYFHVRYYFLQNTCGLW